MSNPRPLLLGYIRADALRIGTDLPRAEAQLEAFAGREGYSLGTVFVERGVTPGAFDALMGEVTRAEAWGVVVPDQRHVTAVEEQVLTGHDDGARTAIHVASISPDPGGPGVVPPSRQVRRSNLTGLPEPRRGRSSLRAAGTGS